MQDVLKIVMPIIVVHAVVLVAVIFLIKRLLLNDTMKAVKKINEVEAEVRKKEEVVRREIADHEKEYAARRAKAEEDMRNQKEQAEKEIMAFKEKIIGEAKEEAKHTVEKAKSNEEKFRQQLRREMEDKSVKYAGEIFRMVFSDTLTDALNQKFIEELLSELEDVDTSSVTVEEGEGTFTVSRPLAPEQKAHLEQVIASKFGVTSGVVEAVDPDVLAGLVLKLGSLEIDGTLRSRCDEAAEEIMKAIEA